MSVHSFPKKAPETDWELKLKRANQLRLLSYELGSDVFEAAANETMRELIVAGAERADLIAAIERACDDADAYRVGKNFEQAAQLTQDAVCLMRALMRHDRATRRRVSGGEHLRHVRELEAAAIEFEAGLRRAIPDEIEREEAILAFQTLWRESAMSVVVTASDFEPA